MAEEDGQRRRCAGIGCRERNRCTCGFLGTRHRDRCAGAFGGHCSNRYPRSSCDQQVQGNDGQWDRSRYSYEDRCRNEHGDEHQRGYHRGLDFSGYEYGDSGNARRERAVSHCLSEELSNLHERSGDVDWR